MDGRLRDYLRGISAPASDMAVAALLFSMAAAVAGFEQMRLSLPVWALFLLGQTLVNELLLRRGTAVNLYLLLNILAVGAAVYFVVGGSTCAPASRDFPIWLGLCTAAAGLHGAVAAYKLPTPNGILRYVDVLIAMGALYLFVLYLTDAPAAGSGLLLVFAVIGVDLAAVNRLRLREEGVAVIRGAGAGSKLATAGVLAAIVLLTGAIVGFASGQVHSLVDVLLFLLTRAGQAISAVMGVIGSLLAGIIMVFLSIVPMAPQRVQENMQMKLQEEVSQAAAAAGLTLPPGLLPAAGALLLLGVGIFALYKFRHTKIKLPKAAVGKRKAVRKNGWFAALKQAASRLGDRLALELRYRKHRRTPAGLFLYAERTGRRHKLKRRRSESPGEYLRRFAGTLLIRTDAAGELRRLAAMLDRIYYGGEEIRLGRDEWERYRRLIGEAGRQEDRLAEG